jgi:hypothetical protein
MHTRSLLADIEYELIVLDRTIIDSNKRLWELEKQTEVDKRVYENYIKREIERKSKLRFYTFNYWAPEVIAYKGNFQICGCGPEFTAFYDGNCSERKYLTQLSVSQEQEQKYIDFDTEFNEVKNHLMTLRYNIKKYNMENRFRENNEI